MSGHFIARYDAEWPIEKDGYLGPAAFRRQHELATMPKSGSSNRVSKKTEPVHLDPRSLLLWVIGRVVASMLGLLLVLLASLAALRALKLHLKRL